MLWTGSRLIRFFIELFSSSLCIIFLLCCETRAGSINSVLILKKKKSLFLASLLKFPLKHSLFLILVFIFIYLGGLFSPFLPFPLFSSILTQTNYTCQPGFSLLTVDCWAAVGYSFSSICWIKASIYITPLYTPCCCVCCHSVKKYIHVWTITMYQGINNK